MKEKGLDWIHIITVKYEVTPIMGKITVQLRLRNAARIGKC